MAATAARAQDSRVAPPHTTNPTAAAAAVAATAAAAAAGGGGSRRDTSRARFLFFCSTFEPFVTYNSRLLSYLLCTLLLLLNFTFTFTITCSYLR
jgi:hypothetical protein